MHPNEALVRGFYEAFEKKDLARIDASYAPDATFSDPVFPALEGRDVTAMWRMLSSRAHDLAITVTRASADDRAGRASWQAQYTFAATGRPVTNLIESRFEFAGGRIARQIDSFDFWRWSRMALGPAGAALGWAPFVRNRVRRQAAAQLAKFKEREPPRGASGKP